MRSAGATLLAFSMTLILLAGCARKEEAAAPRGIPSQPASGPAARAPAALSSTGYVAAASSIELYEIQSAELALQRASTKRIRDFASAALEAHRGASMQLSLAGRRLNLLPSATLSSRHQAMMDQLRSAPDFDSLYRRQQVAVNQDGLALHRNYARRGTSPTLRPVAASLVPVFERDLRLLRTF
jgi:putative membrane protein